MVLSFFSEKTASGFYVHTIDEFRLGSRGRVGLGAPSVLATYLLPKVLNSFSDNHPDVLVDIVTKPGQEIEKFVQMGKDRYWYNSKGDG
ncbi:LysR substrate-binding domain-containing protein [Mesobacillus foraminis]|uniref:LysR substrate-binding domain-containing protein n=1 Tax=Mesobacillus foraminis TaxID=279826 RepID=UPI0039A2352B